MIISTWNLRHGGGKRIKAIIQAVSLHSTTDVFVFTEYRNNSNRDFIRNELAHLGYIFQYTTASEPKINTVLIVSKIEFHLETFENLGINKHRIIKVSRDDLIIYGCYFPIKHLKKPLFEFLLNEIEQQADKAIILTGDFNTGKHFLDENGASFVLSGYFTEFERRQVTDAWRYIHKDKKEYSWFSHANNGFRLDHFFVSTELTEKIKSCEYIHTYREKKISDHSMMTLELTT